MKTKMRQFLVLAFCISIVGCSSRKVRYESLPFDPRSLNCDEYDLTALKEAEKSGAYKDFERELKKLIPLGSDEERIICVLDAIGWDYGYTAPHLAYSAGKDLWGLLGPGSNKATINIFLDESRRVKEIDVYVSYGFLG